MIKAGDILIVRVPKIHRYPVGTRMVALVDEDIETPGVVSVHDGEFPVEFFEKETWWMKIKTLAGGGR